MTDFGGKTSIFSHPVYLFLRKFSLQDSRGGSLWVPGNICVYRFRLDNGGSGEGFGPLTLSLRLKDKQGNTLAVGEMGVEPFGDSDASRTQDASLEHECVENVSSVEIMKATEASEGYQTDLPLSVFDPQYYRPLPVSVAGGKAS
ncbi:IrmA family protein [Escherichia coli]|uniref:IrmA family protein n=1 Tax=Escherichia coli TaxID=562 RepID=UPI003F511C15